MSDLMIRGRDLDILYQTLIECLLVGGKGIVKGMVTLVSCARDAAHIRSCQVPGIRHEL